MCVRVFYQRGPNPFFARTILSLLKRERTDLVRSIPNTVHQFSITTKGITPEHIHIKEGWFRYSFILIFSNIVTALWEGDRRSVQSLPISIARKPMQTSWIKRTFWMYNRYCDVSCGSALFRNMDGRSMKITYATTFWIFSFLLWQMDKSFPNFVFGIRRIISSNAVFLWFHGRTIKNYEYDLNCTSTWPRFAKFVGEILVVKQFAFYLCI